MREGRREGGINLPLVLLHDVGQSPLDEQVGDVVHGGPGAGFVFGDSSALGEALVRVEVVGPDGDKRLGKKWKREGGREERTRESHAFLISFRSKTMPSFALLSMHPPRLSFLHAQCTLAYLAVLHQLVLVPVVPRAGVADDLVLPVQVHLLDGLLQLLLKM